MKRFAIVKELPSFLHSRIFVAGLYTLAGFGGLYASFNLAVDRLILLKSPGAALSCDLSEEVSCGKVDQSWQASLMHFGGIELPNAFIGMMAYCVLITVGVSLLSGVKFPRWFNRAALAGQGVMLVFSYWLLSQSFFGWLQKVGEDGDLGEKYGALCPWCVMLMFSTTIMTFMLVHFLVLRDAFDKKPGETLGLPEKIREKWGLFIAKNWQYCMLIALILFLVVALLFKYKKTLLGL